MKNFAERLLEDNFSKEIVTRFCQQATQQNQWFQPKIRKGCQARKHRLLNRQRVQVFETWSDLVDWQVEEVDPQPDRTQLVTTPTFGMLRVKSICGFRV